MAAIVPPFNNTAWQYVICCGWNLTICYTKAMTWPFGMAGHGAHNCSWRPMRWWQKWQKTHLHRHIETGSTDPTHFHGITNPWPKIMWNTKALQPSSSVFCHSHFLAFLFHLWKQWQTFLASSNPFSSDLSPSLCSWFSRPFLAIISVTYLFIGFQLILALHF